MKAVLGELVWGYVVPHDACGYGIAQEAANHSPQLLFGVAVTFMMAVEKGGQVGVMVTSGAMHDECVRGEHCGQSIERVLDIPAGLGELLQVAVDLAGVPGVEDGVHVGKVFVEGCSPDPGLLGYLRHRDRSQPLFGYERNRRVLDGLTHLVAVGLDRVGPQLRHGLSIQSVFDRDIVSRKLRGDSSRRSSCPTTHRSHRPDLCG